MSTTVSSQESKPMRSYRGLFASMLVGAILSLISSFVLAIDAVELAKNPGATFACDINSVISCGKVGASPQAAVLGFPNAFLGIMFEPMVITMAVGALGGVRFPRWFTLTAQTIYTIALGFAYWLFLQSYFVIGALCPWCLLVTVSTTFVFFTMLSYNAQEGHLGLRGKLGEKMKGFASMGGFTLVGVALIAILVIMIIVKYGPWLLA